jgi:hypothetical protein
MCALCARQFPPQAVKKRVAVSQFSTREKIKETKALSQRRSKKLMNFSSAIISSLITHNITHKYNTTRLV